MPATKPSTRYLDPAALARLKNLGLAARLVVDGLYTGEHKSPRKGFSVEFAEHRQYTPGVDLRHLDWKVFAKRDKLYVKQYEEQTNLRCYLLLDASKSMGYMHYGDITKLEYACFCAASLAYLMQTQHDAFGLIVFNDQVRTHIPPRQGKGHLRTVLETLEQVSPQGETDLAVTFHQLAETMKRRALVVILSDMFSDKTTSTSSNGDDYGVGAINDAIGHLRHEKHEVVLMHILDRAELEFPFSNAGQIEDMETGHIITADAEAIRRHYLEQVNRYIEAIRTGCQMRDVGYTLGETSQRFDQFLTMYLTRRLNEGRIRGAG